MIDVINKKCQFQNCKIRASFNKTDETSGIFCKKHKETCMKDVVSKRCQFPDGCDKIPNYNFSSETIGILCKDHKKTGMIDVKNKKCQFPEGCDKQPNYNFSEKKSGIFCCRHKEEGMIDIINKTCIECNHTRANPKYIKHCLRLVSIRVLCVFQFFPLATDLQLQFNNYKRG
jgi:hypothetical protein